MSKRGGDPGLHVLWLLAVLLLAGGGVADAQDGEMERIPAPPASAGSMGILPAGGMTGGGGGASAGTGAPGAMGCSGFMPCSDPSQGTGALISFEISLASEIASLKLDQLEITLSIGGKPVSWSPRILPEPGMPLSFPMTTQFMQTCADEYGDAISTVEGFVGSKLVARAAGMVHTENCAAVIPNVILQPVAQPSGGAGAAGGSAGSTGTSQAGTSSPDTSAAGRSGTAGSSSADSGKPSLDDSSSEDDGSCSCSAPGAVHPKSSLAAVTLTLAIAGITARRRRRQARGCR